nr:hypothetical protein GCM10020093_004320 [Planobispora longispora]
MGANMNGGRRPTLEAVAALAGVGRGTVSRVINGSPKVSEKAREAVHRAIDELGYVPNRAARALVTRRTDTVALVVSESELRVFDEPYFAGTIRGIGSALSETGLQLILAMAQSQQEHERLELYLTGQHVDGVLLISLHGADPLPGRLEAMGVPTVIGGRPIGLDPYSYVDVDNRAGARQAVKYLLGRAAGGSPPSRARRTWGWASTVWRATATRCSPPGCRRSSPTATSARRAAWPPCARSWPTTPDWTRSSPPPIRWRWARCGCCARRARTSPGTSR